MDLSPTRMTSPGRTPDAPPRRSVAKPRVFKICGAWVWRCTTVHDPTGGEYFEYDWPGAWSSCLADALRHRALYHPAGSEPADELEVP